MVRRPPPAGSEKEMLQAFLEKQRDVMVWKLEGASHEDLHVDPDESTEDVLAFYARARAAADQVIEELDLDAEGTAWSGASVSLRWVLLHMIEETARHTGHADIVRELADGTVGYLPPDY